MATRKRARAATSAGAAQDMGNSMAESAQKIWLAGLGALERARAEGPKMFDVLVEQGRALGGMAREVADEALRDVLSRVAPKPPRKAPARAAAARRKAKRAARGARRKARGRS